jgi:type II secretory pathway pseudopilin PulG
MNQNGFILIELAVSTALFGITAAAAVQLAGGILRVQEGYEARATAVHIAAAKLEEARPANGIETGTTTSVIIQGDCHFEVVETRIPSDYRLVDHFVTVKWREKGREQSVSVSTTWPGSG